MTPASLDKVLMTVLISCVLLSGFIPATAQRNAFHFSRLPQFQAASHHTWLYRIPDDSVYHIVFAGGKIDPATSWMRERSLIAPPGKADSVLRLPQTAPGYYLAVNARNNNIELGFVHKQSFRVNVDMLEHTSILTVLDTNDRYIRDAIVMRNNKQIPFNTLMNGYVLNDYDNLDLISIRYEGDVHFMNCSVIPNYNYRGGGARNVVEDANRENRIYNGYLVTNMPKYRPGDTVKWKAYLLHPQLKNRPVEEPLNISFNAGWYEYKTYVISPDFAPASPGVYFGEFILGDTVKTDKQYTLTLTGNKSNFSIRTVFDLEDYLLEETNLKVTTDGTTIHQPGDSVNLYAYAFNSNNLPLLDGKITVTALPVYNNRKPEQREFIPDTLYTATVPVSADGETNIGFPTAGFPGIMREFDVFVTLVNSNFETKQESFRFTYSADDRYIRMKQSGNKLIAELIRNKKSVPGKGAMVMHYAGSSAAEVAVPFPYEHILSDRDVNITFHAKDEKGRILYSLTEAVKEADITGTEDFKGDTAVLKLINPNKILYRYSIYTGNKYKGYGYTRSDTTIKVYSKKGKTVTVIGAFTWRGRSVHRRFEVVKMDKQLNIDVKKKDLIYPGQQDSIAISLSDKNGKGIARTNVTVLAFNSQFKEDHVPDVPYGGLLFPAYTPTHNRYISDKPVGHPGARAADSLWLSRCGADTQFFYKNLYLLPDDIAWVSYDIPESVMPQLGLFLYSNKSYYQPELIYVDNQPVYVKRACSNNPSGFFVTEGEHTIRFRTANAEYFMEHVYACKGTKTDIYLDIDSVGPFYRRDNVGDSVNVYRRDHLRSLVYKNKMPDTLATYEKDALLASLMIYRPEYNYGDYYNKRRSFGAPLFQQYPYQYDTYGGNGSHYFQGEHLLVIGPFLFNNAVSFFQQYNTKLPFTPERSYIFTFRHQMTRVEKVAADLFFRYRLTDSYIWPSGYVAPNPASWDSLVVDPPEAETIYSYKTAVLEKDRIRHNLKTETGVVKAEAAVAGASIISMEDSAIQYAIYRRLIRPDSVYIYSGCFNCGLRMLPGKYQLTVVWRNGYTSVYDSVMLKNGGITVIPATYTIAKDRIDLKNPPRWLRRYLLSDTLKGAQYNFYTVNESVQVVREFDGSLNGRGGIHGTLTDEKGSPLTSAQVTVSQGGIQRGGAVTNFDGEYTIRTLDPGRYDITFKWQNFQQTITGVIVYTDAMSTVNNKLWTTVTLGKKEIVIMASRPNAPPLVDAKRPGGRQTKTTEQIEKMPTTSISNLASISVDAYQSGNGRGISSGGARAAGIQYIIDGVVVSGGNTNPVLGSADQTSIYPNGIAGTYGDASGGVIGTQGGKRNYYLSSGRSKDFIGNFMANMMGASGRRKHFRDWAIWEPNLWTNEEGQTAFKVTYPDNMTSWKTYVLAMNRNRFAGRIMTVTRSFKPLSAQLSAPRFLRYGDTVEVIGKVANYTQQPFKLKYAFGCDTVQAKADTIQVHNTRVISFRAAAPVVNKDDTADLTLSFGIAAENGYTDGEEHTIPVMPVGVVESKGQFADLLTDTVFTSTPDARYGRFTGKAKVYIDGSMLEVMLREIEALKEYPHGCNEQLTTKLLAIYYEETIKKMLGNPDFNNTAAKKKILNQLVRAQRPDGGFGWWGGGEADYRITNYIISTMQKINQGGWLDFIIRRGVDHLGAHVEHMSAANQIATLQTLADARYPANYKPILDRISVKDKSIYDRLAMVKIRKVQGLPYRDELDSLMALREESKTGISWGHFSYDWYRDDLAATLLAYEIVKDDSIYSKFIPGITRTLMFNRKNGYYRNTASSGLVLTTLLPDLLKKRSLSERNAKTYLRISGTVNDSLTSFPKVYDVSNSNPRFTFEKKGINPMYVSVVYNYLNINPVARDTDFVVKTFFLDKDYDTVTVLKAGEQIMIRTTVTCKKDAEYIMIEVPIPAGCVQADRKTGHYSYPEAEREHFKERTYIFCNSLRKGTYTFDVALQARYKGSYNLSPARAGMMYFPDEYGHTAVKKVTIR